MVLFVKVVLYLGLLQNTWTCNCFETTTVHEYVLKEYNKNARPVKNSDHQVVIKVNLYLISLDNFDLKRQTVDSRLFLEMAWTDEFLAWEPSIFDNRTRISLDSFAIWIPDLLIGNDEGPFTFLDYSMIGKATVYSDGTVVIWPYFNVEIGCSVEIEYYPFDKQSFYFRVGSWSFTTTEILLEFMECDLKLNKYSKNGEWEISEHYLKSYNQSYGNDFYSRIEYHLSIQRKPLFYILNIIAPVVVTSLLNIMCFILPVESAERVTFSTSIFLTMAVFLTIVSQSLPKTSDGASVTFVYICLQLLGSFVTIVLNVFVLDLYHRKNAAAKSFLAKCLRSTFLYRKYRRENKSASETDDQKLRKAEKEVSTNENQTDSVVDDSKTKHECMEGQRKQKEHKTLQLMQDQVAGLETNDASEVALTLNSLCLGLALFWNMFLILFLITYINI